MKHPKTLFAMSLTMLFTATMTAQAQIPCPLCDQWMPVSVPAGTAFICEPYSNLETLTIKPESVAQTSVLPLSCGIADGDTAGKTRFEAALIGSYKTAPGRTVIAWDQLSFPYAVTAKGVDRVTLEMNDRETFESREWFDGKLRISFKRDFVVAQKH